ncbi:PTS sugar transporter subunit IIA [Anaerovibrio sp.]|uniref:PTS sugar transporter subunit IIA n=1 Tax=Anaerovibrio sp. TaxID=1872532 RepID=UPI003F15F7F8
MTGVIITGHGRFAEGILSAVQLIAGQQEKLAAVNFTEGMTGEGLQAELRQAAEAFGGDELVFCADIAGGTPFNQAVLLANELEGGSGRRCLVFSGTNLPFVLQALFDREDALPELEKRWLEGPVQVTAYHSRKKVQNVQAGGI